MFSPYANTETTIDTTLIDQIQHVVKTFVSWNRMFTAFDVSLFLKKMNVTERHRNMREIVHNMFNTPVMDGWTRTLTNLRLQNNPSAEAWIYHPEHADVEDYFSQPSDYDPNMGIPDNTIHISVVTKTDSSISFQDDAALVAPKKGSLYVKAGPSTVGQNLVQDALDGNDNLLDSSDNVKKGKLTQANRLHIPRRFFDALQISPNQTFYIMACGNFGYLSKYTDLESYGNSVTLLSKRVTSRGDYRVSLSDLEAMGLGSGGTKINISLYTNVSKPCIKITFD